MIHALLSAVWRRRPEREVIIHSDQGSQFARDDRIWFCAAHGLMRSMSRRACRRIAEARADVLDCIGVFYNRKRPHEHPGGMCPVEFEQKKPVA